ncbi:MAG: DNA methyltransferase [Desulfobulbaceae bacterium]|nr:MAG: DNA methyltransferase [Desulfobulbaceae bacterium]
MQDYTRRVIELIQGIPSGMVSTYGTIAAAAGNASGARQVARILHSSSAKYDLPWHRVVNRHGRISERSNMSHELQEQLLAGEGVGFLKPGQIDLDKHLWLGS